MLLMLCASCMAYAQGIEDDRNPYSRHAIQESPHPDPLTSAISPEGIPSVSVRPSSERDDRSLTEPTNLMDEGWWDVFGIWGVYEGPVWAIGPDGNGGILAGGSFYQAGDTICQNLAEWDGSQWLNKEGSVLGDLLEWTCL